VDPDLLSVLPAGPEPAAAAPLQPPAEDLTLPRPGFWGAVGWSLLALLGPVLAGCCIGVWLGLLRQRIQSLDRGLLMVLSHVLLFATMLAIALSNLRGRTRRVLALRGIGGLHLLLVLLLVLPAMMLSNDIANRATQGLDAIFGPQAPVPRPRSGPMPREAYLRFIDEELEELVKLPWPLALLCGCLLPAVGEEVFFRGFLGRGLVARYGAFLGVLLTSLLFALMHIDPVRIAYTFALGLILHLVFLTTRSLVGPMVLHLLYNALGISHAKLEREEILQLTGGSGDLIVPLPLVIASLAAIFGLCWLLYRTQVRWFLADGGEWTPRYVTAEMHPRVRALARRRALGPVSALMAAGAYLAFGACFAPAAIDWLGQGSALAHVHRAEAHLAHREYDQAIAACDEALRLNPRLAAAYLVRSDAYRLKGAYLQAVEDCNQAIEIDPTSAYAFAQRAEAHRLQEDHERALADCNGHCSSTGSWPGLIPFAAPCTMTGTSTPAPSPTGASP
jgi:membrane protease YdiL (CAAX protease family)